ncbi:hypothetical protein niasHS_012701 [Heterodera schachtii]|uniref:Uncharacterized protein n=1 Tax=Heterodera schachtii TaxID=97005 RepID=A0ABD2IB70_HETSC
MQRVVTRCAIALTNEQRSSSERWEIFIVNVCRTNCSAVLPVVQFSDEQLLTVGVAFPAISHFFEDPEGVFLEDIELHTFIPRECVLIYRRGCSDDGSAYEFRIGILSSKYSKFGKVTTAVQPPQLKSLSPLIFTKNRSFMMENGLRIAYIRKISSLPIGAQKGADRWEAALISRK